MIEKRPEITNSFTILIADRNPHVQEFLSRELMAEGYRTQVAKNGREVLRITNSDKPPELMILDLDMPYISGLTVLEDLQKRKSALPVVVHTFLTEYEKHPVVQMVAGFWEKRGDNIDGLKATVAQVLRESYPKRFLPERGKSAQEKARC